VETIKVSSKGQIVIPKRLREAHGIRSGDQFTVSSVGDELRLRPLPAIAPTTVREVAGMLHRPGMERVSDEETEARIIRRLLAEDEATKSR
jgi:AbrB family looped-hinge helix DNA binding protein